MLWGTPAEPNFQEVTPDLAHPDRVIWGFGPSLQGKDQNRLRGDQWLEDGQAEGCEVPDRQQLALAMELAGLLQEKHLLPHLRPAFYLEVSTWIGALLKAPRAETYSPPDTTRAALWVDPQNWEILGTETPMEGRVHPSGVSRCPVSTR